MKRVPFEAYEAITYEEGIEAEEEEEGEGGFGSDDYSSDEESEEGEQEGLWKGMKAEEEEKDERERQERSASEGRGKEGGREAAIRESEKVPTMDGVTGAGGSEVREGARGAAKFLFSNST